MDVTGKAIQTRNLAIDQGRLIAAFMVVLIHVPMPGAVGSVFTTVSRLAVPFFFMISGYYAYGKEKGVLCKRAIKTGKIFLASVFLYFCWDLLRGVLWGYAHDTFAKWISLQTLYETFVLQTGAIKHLWFLITSVYCYMVYTFVFRNTSAKAKAFISILLLCGFFIVTQISRLNGVEDVCYYSRNLLFDGLPFFLLGSVARQERERLSSLPAFLMWFSVIIGFLLSEAERVLVGETDLYFGTMLGCFGMFLLLASDRVPASQMLARLGRKYSRDIYILHMLIYGLINIVVGVGCVVLSIPNISYNSIFCFIRPLIVFFICLILAVLKEKVSVFAHRKATK